MSISTLSVPTYTPTGSGISIRASQSTELLGSNLDDNFALLANKLNEVINYEFGALDGVTFDGSNLMVGPTQTEIKIRPDGSVTMDNVGLETGWYHFDDHGGGNYIGIHDASSSVALYHNSQPTMYWKSGNVGIGTSVPFAPLHVRGPGEDFDPTEYDGYNGSLGGTLSGNPIIHTLILDSETTPDEGVGPSISFRGKSGDSGNTNNLGSSAFATIIGAKENDEVAPVGASSTQVQESAKGYLGFYTAQQYNFDAPGDDADHGTVMNEAMRITSDGKVGIGTSDPHRNLTVAGNFRLEKTAADGGDVALDFNVGGNSDEPEFNIYDKDGAEVFRVGGVGNPLNCVAKITSASTSGTSLYLSNTQTNGGDFRINSDVDGNLKFGRQTNSFKKILMLTHDATSGGPGVGIGTITTPKEDLEIRCLSGSSPDLLLNVGDVSGWKIRNDQQHNEFQIASTIFDPTVTNPTHTGSPYIYTNRFTIGADESGTTLDLGTDAAEVGGDLHIRNDASTGARIYMGNDSGSNWKISAGDNITHGLEFAVCSHDYSSGNYGTHLGYTTLMTMKKWSGDFDDPTTNPLQDDPDFEKTDGVLIDCRGEWFNGSGVRQAPAASAPYGYPLEVRGSFIDDDNQTATRLAGGTSLELFGGDGHATGLRFRTTKSFNNWVTGISRPHGYKLNHNGRFYRARVKISGTTDTAVVPGSGAAADALWMDIGPQIQTASGNRVFYNRSTGDSLLWQKHDDSYDVHNLMELTYGSGYDAGASILGVGATQGNWQGEANSGVKIIAESPGTGYKLGQIVASTQGSSGNAGYRYRTAGVDRWATATIWGNKGCELEVYRKNPDWIAGTWYEDSRVIHNGNLYKVAAGVGFTTEEPGGAGHADWGNLGSSDAVPSHAIMSFKQDGTVAVGRAAVIASDYRLKENIAPISGSSLDRVAGLKPSAYNLKDDPDKPTEGFIAHELAEVLPFAVRGKKDAVSKVEKVVTEAKGEAYIEGIEAVEEVTEVRSVAKTVSREVTKKVVEEVDGKYVQKEVTETVDDVVYEEVPLCGADGEPLTECICPASDAVYETVPAVYETVEVEREGGFETEQRLVSEATTEEVSPAVEECIEPLMHRIPVMVEETVVVTEAVEGTPDEIVASDIPESEAPAGTLWRETTPAVTEEVEQIDAQSVNYSAIIPVLVGAIQELTAKVKELESA